MVHVTVLVLHPEARTGAGDLETLVVAARRRLAEVHRAGFLAAGADEVRVVSGPPDDTPFGARLRSLTTAVQGGLIVLGSGALPLARRSDRAAFVATARSGERRALANNRYSADAVAVGRATLLSDIPDLEADNALPRWLAERAGVAVEDLGGRWRLAIDLDGPLDVLLAAGDRSAPAALRAAAGDLEPLASGVRRAVRGLAATLRDPRAEVLVAGRTGSRSLRWLERSVPARTRVLIEERGLRASSALAQSSGPSRPRPPASILGMLLDRDGPAALGPIVARLADAAAIDTRVLLAHRLGADERAWPPVADRFGSDLLRPDLVADPWLRELTGSAAAAEVPIVLGGHTIVGPGLRLLAGAPST